MKKTLLSITLVIIILLGLNFHLKSKVPMKNPIILEEVVIISNTNLLPEVIIYANKN